MKKILLKTLAVFITATASAQQVPLISVVEHFTNTKCGVCASRNPGFNTNVAKFTGMWRITVNPSAPYNTCFLSQQNTATNDARTNYYGIYGGTPRLVANSTVISGGANYSDSAVLAPYQNLMSSFAMQASSVYKGTDSITYEIKIKKVDTSTITSAILFTGNVEDTISQNGGNGELEHFNVLRQAIQETVTLPANVGDSLVLSKTVWLNTIWNKDRINAFAIMQQVGNKKVLQTALGKGIATPVIVIPAAVAKINLSDKPSIYPNPTSDFIRINSTKTYSYTVINNFGQIVKEGSVSAATPIEIGSLNDGLFLVRLFTRLDSYIFKVSISK
jgi:Secretion system C-terminal sorting domain